MLQVTSATRLDTCQICVDQLKPQVLLSQARQVPNMPNRSRRLHNRTMILTMPFSTFREILSLLSVKLIFQGKPLKFD